MKVLGKKTQGSVMVEYALLIGLVAIPAAWGLAYLGGSLQHFFINVANHTVNSFVTGATQL